MHINKKLKGSPNPLKPLQQVEHALIQTQSSAALNIFLFFFPHLTWFEGCLKIGTRNRFKKERKMVHFKQGSFPYSKRTFRKWRLQIRFHSLPNTKELFTAWEIPTHYLSSLFFLKVGKSKISQRLQFKKQLSL